MPDHDTGWRTDVPVRQEKACGKTGGITTKMNRICRPRREEG